MKEAADEKEKQKHGKKGKGRASKRATQIGNTPVVDEEIEDEDEVVEVEVFDSIEVGM